MNKTSRLFQLISTPNTTFSVEAELTKEVLINTLGKNAGIKEGQVNPEFIVQATQLIHWISGDRKASFHVNRLLLEHGDLICPQLHEDMYAMLLKGIEQQIGFGKGVFMSTMLHMTERFSRTQLAQWLRQPDILNSITTNLRQAALNSALALGKYSLAHDMALWMESLGESVSVQTCLVMFDRTCISRAGLSDALPVTLHVEQLCQRKAYMQAMTIAQDEVSLARVRKALADAMGIKDSSWKGLLGKLCHELGESTYDSNTLLERYRSVGAVLLEHLKDMDEATRKAELIDDDLRLMAYKLGVKESVHEMESSRHKRDVLIHDLAL